MSMIVKNPNVETARKYDFAAGESLGEEIREALKNGENEDGAVVISADTAKKIEKFFDSKWHGTTIDRAELFAYANSDVQAYFSVDHDGGFSENYDLMEAILSGQLGVTVNSDARAIAAQIQTWNNDGDDQFIVNSAGSSEKAQNRALVARALLNYNEAGESRWDESPIQMKKSTAKELTEYRDVFGSKDNDKQNLRVLKNFVAKMADGEAKSILTKFVASME
jgi:hypothetical protein